MSFIEEVIRNTRHIEYCLEARGGSGSGLIDKSRSARLPLDQNLLARIDSIAPVRNKISHEHGYRFEGNETEFLAACESVLTELGANIEAKNSLDQARMGGAMDNTSSNIWIEVDDENIRGNTYESTLEKRLVFYAGGAFVKPVGKHKAGSTFSLGGFLPTVDAIGLVKMTSGHIKVTSSGGITTSDGIPIEIEVILSIKVLDNVPAITRVALDATNAEETLISNSARTVLRTAIGKCSSQNLHAKLSEIEREVKEAMLLNKQQEFSFEVIYVSIKIAKASDAAIADQAVLLAQIEAEREKFRLSEELRKMQAAAEAAKIADERKADLIHLKELADVKHEEATRQAELDSKRRRDEDATKIKLARITAQTQIAIAGNNDLKRYLPMLIGSAIFKGKVEALEQVAEKTYGMKISHAFADETIDTPSTSADEAVGKPTTPPSPPIPSAEGDGSDQPG